MKNWRYWPDLLFQFPLVAKLIISCYAAGMKPYNLLKADFGLEEGNVNSASKYHINNKFVTKQLLKFELIKTENSPATRVKILQEFMKKQKLHFPIILKPDTGRSGMGAILIKNVEQAKKFLKEIKVNYLAQEYCEWPLEYGIFYYKLNGKPNILSINQKVIPTIIGTGKHSIKKIIKQDKDTKHIKHALKKQLLRQKPNKGEQIQLTNIGNISQGAIYKDRTYLATPALLKVIDKIVKDKGYYYGKLDIKTPSTKDLGKGNFKIIEINGITSFASSCYDPQYNIKKAYKMLSKQYKILMQIALENKHITIEKPKMIKLLTKTHVAEKRLKKQQKITSKHKTNN
ncbi:hypothetical protein K9M74_02225 [Candidatus Woesearchaeota archaeon]|nr:hypothetical protein [Candidatus Woesearchaeota archaeon]